MAPPLAVVYLPLLFSSLSLSLLARNNVLIKNTKQCLATIDPGGGGGGGGGGEKWVGIGGSHHCPEPFVSVHQSFEKKNTLEKSKRIG